MVSLEKLARPEFIEGRSSELMEGKLMGGIPAEITSLDDPEKIGRIQVRCPLIDENVNLPNGEDGWVNVPSLLRLKTFYNR